MCLVKYSDFPQLANGQGDAQAALDSARKVILATSGGELLKEEQITLDGHPGRSMWIEARAEGYTMSLVYRTYVVGPRMYQIMIAGPQGQVDGAVATEFLNSFKLVPETWTLHDSPAGRYSILFPTAPKLSTLPLPTEEGNIDMHLAGAGSSDIYFGVMHNDFPEKVVAQGDTETMLDGARDNMIATHNGTLLKEVRITLDGHPGRELSIEAVAEGTEATIRSRMFHARPRMYQLIVVGKKGKVNEAEVTKFFDSFKLKAE
jgi:hypothetical protein